jgi:hypothetical protein
MTCRKRIDGIETGVELLPRDGVWRVPADWPGGVRHEGGASVVWALVRNVGTCRPASAGGQWRSIGLRLPGGRETPEQRELRGVEYRAGHRGGPSRSSGEGPVMGLERRGRVVRAGFEVNRLWVGGAG